MKVFLIVKIKDIIQKKEKNISIKKTKKTKKTKKQKKFSFFMFKQKKKQKKWKKKNRKKIIFQNHQSIKGLLFTITI